MTQLIAVGQTRTKINAVFLLALTLAFQGCSRGFPSYSGVYRLKEVSRAQTELPIEVDFPDQVKVVQYPFDLYNGVVTTKISAAGYWKDQTAGKYFEAKDLQSSPDTSASFSVVPGEILSDSQSDPIVEPNTKRSSPSCRYAYGAEARLVFSVSMETFTEATQGIYPRLEIETIGSTPTSVRPPGQWSDRPIRYAIWDSTPQELTLHFSIYRKSAYGNLGTCSYQGNTLPKEDAAFHYSATYLLEGESDRDPRIPQSDDAMKTQVSQALGDNLLPSAWERTFSLPAHAAQLKAFFENIP